MLSGNELTTKSSDRFNSILPENSSFLDLFNKLFKFNTRRGEQKLTYFMISIDTEENQWDAFNDKATVKNIECITEKFQTLCEQYGIKTTYLVNNPVIEAHSSQKIIKKLADSGNCEIGMHLHPWRLSPHIPNYQFPRDSHITNYSSDIIGEKIKKLFHEIQNLTQKPCRTFRAGRWSMSMDAMEHLFKLGVNIDTSITPYISWEKGGGNNYLQSSLHSYKFLSPNFLEPNENGNAYEVPPSVGWTRGDLDTMYLIEKFINKIPLLSRAKGILYHLNLVKKVWVSPEQVNLKDMIMLCQNLMRQRQLYIHAMFHSTSLLPGASPFIRNEKELALFYAKIEKLFQYIQSEQLRPVTISEYVKEVYSS